jgi:hypothetical protein
MTWEELKRFNFQELIELLEKDVKLEIEKTMKTFDPLMLGSNLERKIGASFQLNTTLSSVIFERTLSNLKIMCSLRDGLLIIESKLNDISKRMNLLETMERYR